MNRHLLSGLRMCETDIEGALRRFSGDEELYRSCLAAFVQDPTMDQLTAAIAAQEWDDAFTAAHALKGLAGNMGFTPLFHASAELVVLIRTGRVRDVAAYNEQVRYYYKEIVSVIQDHVDVPSPV